MKEFIEKLIGRLEEYPHGKYEDEYGKGFSNGINVAIEEVNELAEEYKNTDIITDFLQYARDNADNYDTNEGWSLADLIDLSIKFTEEYSAKTPQNSAVNPTTNADKIRGMTDEELAEFLYDTNHYFENNEYLVRFGSEIVQDEEISILDWLQSEVEGVTENE